MINLKTILLRLQENLELLRGREAKRGGSNSAPLELIGEIREQEKFIETVKQAIEANEELLDNLRWFNLPENHRNEVESHLAQLLGEEVDHSLLASTLEDKESEIDKIERSKQELINELLHFKHWQIEDIEQSAGHRIARVYTDLRKKCYVWKLAVSPRLNHPPSRHDLETIYLDILDFHEPTRDFSLKIPKLIEQIEIISALATKFNNRN